MMTAWGLPGDRLSQYIYIRWRHPLDLRSLLANAQIINLNNICIAFLFVAIIY